MSKNREIVRDFTQGSVTKTLLTFALPFILSNFLQTFYNLVDMAFVGQFVGKTGLSAVSVGGDLLHFFTFICMGVSTAAQIIISQYLGKKEPDKVSKTIGTFSFFLFAVAILLSLIGIIFANPLLHLLNAPEEAFSQAKDYIIVCSAGLVFTFGYNATSSVMRALGDSETPFKFVLLATVINIVLDYLFVGVFDMKAFGAALATIIGQCVSFISCLLFLSRHREKLGFEITREMFIPDMKILGSILKLGIPMALQTCSLSLSILFVNSQINSLGLVESAVNGVSGKIGNIAGIVTTGLNQAGSSMAGQNFGAGKMDRVSKIMLVVGGFSMVFSVALSVILALFPEACFGVFNKDPEVLALSHTYVFCGILTFIGFAARAPFVTLINGIGYAMMGFIISIMDGVVLRIGLSLIFGNVFHMGIQGYWLGMAISGYTFLFMGGVYYLTGKWKTRPLAVK